MTAHRIRARDFLSDEELAELRTRRTWKSVALIAHAWALIFCAVAVVALWPNPLTYLLAVAIIGSRQLGLAILMHDGAHGALANGAKLNMALSQWFCAYPVFAETQAYRALSSAASRAHPAGRTIPISCCPRRFRSRELSYRRKFWRDITGQTGFAQRKAQILNALGDRHGRSARRAAHFWRKLGPQCVVNAMLFAGLAAAGVWWAYPLLWLVPLLTWMMVITRIRNIAEHAVVPDSDDPLRNTRTTEAGFLGAPVHRAVLRQLSPRASSAVLSCPATICRACTDSDARPARARAWKCSRAMPRCCGSRRRKPPQEDRPGELANSARRARAGAAVDEQSGGVRVLAAQRRREVAQPQLHPAQSTRCCASASWRPPQRSGFVYL